LSNTFRVQTAHGTVLAFDLAKGRVVHRRVSELSADKPAALLYIPPKSPSLAFLLADNPDAIPVAPSFEEACSPILTLRRRRLPSFVTYAFCHPHRRNYLLTRPELEADGSGIVAFYATEPSDWERCHLIGNADLDIARSVQSQIAQIQCALDAIPNAILPLLLQTPPAERQKLSGLLGSMLEPADAERLGASLLLEPALNTELAELLPDDLWAVIALPELRAFLRYREIRSPLKTPAVKHNPAVEPGLPGLLVAGEPASPESPPTISANATINGARSIGIPFDPVTQAGFTGEYASLAHYCNAAVRRTVPPRRDICIVATARNEGLYLIEWIAYHKSIGVDHFFIYTNDNDDGSGSMLRALAAAGEITLIENTVARGGSPQGKAYGHALGMLADVLDYRWCAIIDVDEFIGFDRHMFTSIKEYIAWQELQPVDAIILNWLVFGSGGASRWQDEPMPHRFRSRPAADPGQHVKTILRPRLFHHSHAHVPKSGGDLSIICRDAAGGVGSIRESLSSSPKDGPAWIAHYFFRSAEEFVWKFSRGRGDIHLECSSSEVQVPESFVAQFVAQQHAHGFLDERTVWCAEGMISEIERLSCLPRISETRRAVVEHYRARSAVLEVVMSRMRETPSTPCARQIADAFFGEANL
jgi:hypothetical protein